MKIRLIYNIDSLIKSPEQIGYVDCNDGSRAAYTHVEPDHTETREYSESFETIDDAVSYFKIKVMGKPGLRGQKIIVSFPV